MGKYLFPLYAFAAASTIIAVFENIISFAMDLTGCSRGKAVAVNLVVIILLSLPCVFGFNLLSGFQPLGREARSLIWKILSSAITFFRLEVLYIFCFVQAVMAGDGRTSARKLMRERELNSQNGHGSMCHISFR